MDITKTHSTEIYKDEQHGHHGDVHVAHLYISVLCFLVMSMLLIFIYFCVLCFGDVHVTHLYIFLCMDITKKHSTEIYKDENMDITKKHNTEIYKDEQHGHHQKP
jgi:hypothetical protein